MAYFMTDQAGQLCFVRHDIQHTAGDVDFSGAKRTISLNATSVWNVDPNILDAPLLIRLQCSQLFSQIVNVTFDLLILNGSCVDALLPASRILLTCIQ